MFRYSTNWMGPINYDWIHKNGNHWASGRIDVYGGDEPYPDEIGFGTMHVEDWNRLSEIMIGSNQLISYSESN